MLGKCEQFFVDDPIMIGVSVLPHYGEAKMLKAVLSAPVATYISIPPSMSLLNYKTGIYTDANCMTNSNNAQTHGGT